MSCEQHNLIQAYYDGQVAQDEALIAQLHLSRCAECRELYGSLKQVSAVVRDTPMRRPSEMTMARLNGSIALRQDRTVRRFTGWLTSAAAALVVGVMLLSPSGQTQPAAYGQASDDAVVNLAMFHRSTSDEPEVMLAARWITVDLSSSGEAQP